MSLKNFGLVALLAPFVLLAACAPSPAVSMSDLYLYGDANVRLSYFYGEPTELQSRTETLALSPRPGLVQSNTDPYEVPSSLLVNGEPYLRTDVAPLDGPVVSLSRIPLTTDVQVRVEADTGPIVYFDGGAFLLITNQGVAGRDQRLVPRALVGGLRGLGELTTAEARMLESSFTRAGKAAVLAFLPTSQLPPHSVDGVEEQRRTSIYVQTDIRTDESTYRAPPSDLFFESVASGSNASGVASTSFKLVTGQSDLRATWNLAYGNSLTVPSVPQLDFGRETVVALFLGQKSTGGYGISVDRVTEERGELYLDVTMREPAAGAIVTQALTSPWLIVRVLRGGYDVAWIRDRSTGALIGAARAGSF